MTVFMSASAIPIDFEALFEIAPCGYLLTDRDGRISRGNKTLANWVGRAADELLGLRFSDLLPIAGKMFYETHLAPSLHMQGSFTEVALDLKGRGGAKIPMLVNAIERRSEGGTPFICFTLFMAAQRRAYELGLLEERDEANAAIAAEREEGELRERFIAVLGHDLRNPLASLASGLQMLSKENLSERGRKVLGLMDGSIVRATGLIDNVLDFARGRLGGGITLNRDASEPLEPMLQQVVSELQAIAPARSVDVSYDLDVPINCDRVRIGQLLSNLLGNALTHGARDKPVRVQATTNERQLKIVVANGGVPIPPDARLHLFEPFFRADGHTSGKGLGLGLHIACEIARAHGGTLKVRSDEVETAFTFTMPLDETQEPST
ncbi:PAS domain-containing sensor histidine kinase [Novosphingobium sp. ST904]|uniref:PAS domain-containing sensor histidine kinase n=2 Tax=Novosphingobium sp. ST904 TaxID=1684385 RepID=UPI001A9CF06B|nr:PAS domain-containing sensor histidine kinase [Novosphingobium sp. ST904]